MASPGKSASGVGDRFSVGDQDRIDWRLGHDEVVAVEVVAAGFSDTPFNKVPGKVDVKMT